MHLLSNLNVNSSSECGMEMPASWPVGPSPVRRNEKWVMDSFIQTHKWGGKRWWEQEPLKVTGWAGYERHWWFIWGKNSLAERNGWNRDLKHHRRGEVWKATIRVVYAFAPHMEHKTSETDWPKWLGSEFPPAANSWRDLGKGIHFLWAAAIGTCFFVSSWVIL